MGQPWVRYQLVEKKDSDGKVQITGTADDAIAKATAKLLANLGIKRAGLSFYALRHTTETVGGGCRDQVAVDAVLGHCDASMAAEYREGLADSRLLAVTDHIRSWFLAGKRRSKCTGTRSHFPGTRCESGSALHARFLSRSA